jgi:hypothetical protein
MEHVTVRDCQLAKENCAKHNIAPLQCAVDELKEIMKDIQKDVKEMKPSFKVVKAAETTASVIGSTMKWLMVFFLFCSTLVGIAYSFKEWILKK